MHKAKVNLFFVILFILIIQPIYSAKDISYIPDLAVGYETGWGVSTFIGDGEGGFEGEQNNYTGLMQDIAAADFNGDGNLDIVAADAFWEIEIYFGDGSGGMSAPTIISYDQPYAVATGDFDGTNGIDFVVSDVTGNFIDTYLNDGSGSFSHYGQYSVGAYPTDIDTGDFNGDAYLDLVVVNESANSISILINDGSGGFATRADSTVGTTPKQVEVADFNDDTHLDLAITNNGDDNITLYFGDGAGAFSNEQQFTVGNEPWGIELGHFNFDYVPDLVVTNYADNDISILVNDGTGDFSDRSDYATGAGASPNDVAVGHLNDDGTHDLVVCHRASNSMDILINNGSHQFPTTSPIGCNNFPFSVLLDDFNNDSYVIPTTSFHVTNTDNDGDGSLRWAIIEAVNHPGRDTILFDVSGTIQPLTNYYSLYDPDGTIILGSSAPGKAGSVTLDLSLSSSTFGLATSTSSKHNVIEGLNFTNGQTGIWIDGDSNVFINNHIDYMSASGIFVNIGNYNRIGGYNAGEGNLIEYCEGHGIAVYWDYNQVIGNRISHITTPVPVYGDGITVAGCYYNLIDSNIVDSCQGNGINVHSNAYYNTISRNQLFNNGNLGIDLDNDGVTLNDVDDLDNGSNRLLNYPELDSIHINDDYSYAIFGSADTLARVEFFRASTALDTTVPPDPSGYGEARDYIGYTECDNNAKFVDTIPKWYAWSSISMTTTDTSGNTSELSYNFSLLPSPFIIFAWADVPEKGRGQTDSVINLRVTDPNGDVIGRDAFDVLEQTLFPADYIETGLIDSINVPAPEYGEYNIEVLGEDGSPTDATYTMGIRIDGSLALFVTEGMSVPTAGGPPDSATYVVEAGWHYINGDANRDDIINIFDVTYLITYLYKDGSAPDPESAGDSNCDLLVNIFDVTYLITYLYKEGPHPCNNPDAGD